MAVSIQEVQAIPTFQALSGTTLEQLATASTLLPFKSGMKFYQQGDPPTGLYSLQAGEVKLYRRSHDRMQIFYIAGAGATFGAESLPNEAPSPCTSEALTAGTALYLPPEALRELLLTCPDFLLMQLELVSKQLRQFTGLVHSLAFRDVSARLAETLLRLKRQSENEYAYVEKNFSQQDLAAMVGTVREVIYRTLKKFEKEGLIILNSENIVLRDVDGLMELANQEMK